MKYRLLDYTDCLRYRDDILHCYQTNHFIFDSQNILHIDTPELAQEFILKYIEADDSCVQGIFDDNEEYLYGLVIYDFIRCTDKHTSTQVHIINDKAIFGRVIRKLYKEIIECSPFTTIYAEIPSIAVHAIALAKHMGFKKTGYVPNVIPYVNSKGEEKMYDLIILSYTKEVK